MSENSSIEEKPVVEPEDRPTDPGMNIPVEVDPAPSASEEHPDDKEWFGNAKGEEPKRSDLEKTVIIARNRPPKPASSRFWPTVSLTMCAISMLAMAYSFVRVRRENVAAATVVVIEKAAEAIKAPPPPAPKRVVSKIDASKCKKGQMKMKGRELIIDPACSSVTYSEEPGAQ